MYRSLAFLGLSLFVTAGCIWAGCQSSSTVGTGGATSSASVGGAGGSLGMGGNTSCNGDGVCQLDMMEDCTCIDCQTTAFCNPGQCTDTTSCDHMLDSCTCAGCAEDAYCGDPTLSNCQNDGGACDPYIEGCHCPNCFTYPECMASVTACAGGKPDGVCDRATENCDCVDCQGTPLCVPCMNLGQCLDNEPCDCADCLTNDICTDPSRCVDDGVCAILAEGCICNDCKDLPECTQWLDGGAEGGTDGGGTDGGGADGGGVDAGTDAATDAGDGGP